MSRAWLASTASLLAVACGNGGEDGLGIPMPPELDVLEPVLVERIRKESAALEADPRSRAHWMSLGMTYEANALNEYALECYDRAQALEESAKCWSRIGQARKELGRLEGAALALQRSIELQEEYAPSHWRLGGMLFDLGEFEAARASYRRATELDPKHSGGWIGLARVELQAGEARRAVEILERLLARDPGDADGHRLLRTAYLQDGRPDDAAKVNASWNRMSSPGKDPWHREFRAYRERPLMERALGELTGGDPAAAVQMLEEFAQEAPDDLNALSYLAWAYFQTGREPEALATLDRALERDPRNVPTLRVLARIHERSGRPREALQVVTRIVEADGLDTQALKKKGRLSKDLGDCDAAIGAFASLLELDRGDGDAWLWKGECELQLERWSEATDTFRLALRNKATTDEISLGLARALAAQGKWDEALAALDRVPANDPRGRELRDSIGRRER